ncbi:B3 domain-containing transcription factor ABI3-like [Senna tora]|uniref:B3 domain-containing transcription factor ABI3-like n=1 Tax=Senna tora TaxID=362788 RepID=A0A834XHT0_9FABA|nr:B3 domain-containing transcription factor ABI3-like [Senna tora]
MNGGSVVGDVFEEEAAVMAAVKERERWLRDVKNDDMEDASMLFADPLPDFQCMSSSSSSSKSNYATASMEIPQPSDQSGGGDYCMDTMDTFGSMELLETNDFFDPSSIFQDLELAELAEQNSNYPSEIIKQEKAAAVDEEMSGVFLEWLKMNKESVSASELRSVRLKKSTIEYAAKRLGGGKQGMKQLLKLILQWLQTTHLHNKPRKPQTQNDSNFVNNINTTPFQGKPPSTTPVSFTSPLPYPAGYVGMGMGDPFSNGAYYNQMNQSFGDSNLQALPPPLYQNPFQYFEGENGMRSGHSATKEARKKRMARQRRHLSRHRHYHNNEVTIGHQNQNNNGDYLHIANNNNNNNPPNWLYWPPMVAVGGGGGPTSVAPASGQNAADRTAMQSRQNYEQGLLMSSSDRGQQGSSSSSSCKPEEKNLRFLLQKVLKQSDVSSLGRIVLPKKEAEIHLPELETRDGISIAMEDIGISRVWNMRYRYWPNNKSRMYLLENTGDFVRANGLQEGDFIVIYSDVKCGKFMIRGVKVRLAGLKTETKKAGKSQKNQHGNISTDQANDSLSSSPNTAQTQKIRKLS